MPEALSNPQVAGRGLLARFENVPGVGRDIEVARTGVRIDGESPSVSDPPPMLGADTESVLAEFGLDGGEIASLREEGAI